MIQISYQMVIGLDITLVWLSLLEVFLDVRKEVFLDVFLNVYLEVFLVAVFLDIFLDRDRTIGYPRHS